jgi:hypothetical protein
MISPSDLRITIGSNLGDSGPSVSPGVAGNVQPASRRRTGTDSALFHRGAIAPGALKHRSRGASWRPRTWGASGLCVAWLRQVPERRHMIFVIEASQDFYC